MYFISTCFFLQILAQMES